MTDITDSLHRAGTPPCETFDCPQRKICGEEKMACRAFGEYVKFGNIGYVRLLWNKWIWSHIAWGRHVWKGHEDMIPSKAKYDEIFNENKEYL